MPPFNDVADTKSYEQYLADIATEGNEEDFRKEAAFRLNEGLGNILIDEGLIESDDKASIMLNVDRKIHDINNKLMDDIATTLKADMERDRLHNDGKIDFDVDNLSRDVLLAGTSDITYAESPLGQEALGSNKYGIGRSVFDEAYARKYTAEGDRLLALDWKDSEDSIALVTHRNETFVQDESSKFNAMTGQLRSSYYDMPMTTEFAQAAFEQFDRDKQEALDAGYDETKVNKAHTMASKFSHVMWLDYGVDTDTAAIYATQQRGKEKLTQDSRFAALDDYVSKFRDDPAYGTLGFER